MVFPHLLLTLLGRAALGALAVAVHDLARRADGARRQRGSAMRERREGLGLCFRASRRYLSIVECGARYVWLAAPAAACTTTAARRCAAAAI